MARTWTLVDTLELSTIPPGSIRVVTGAGKVYFYAGVHNFTSARKIYSWDGTTATDISGSSLPTTLDGFSAEFQDICFFNGDLFIGYGPHVATASDRIYKWAGGTSWTDEHSLVDESDNFAFFSGAVPTNQEGRYWRMDCDNTYMFISCTTDILNPETDSRLVARNTSGTYAVAQMPGGGYTAPTPHLVGLSKGSRYGSVIGMNRTGASTYRAIVRGSPDFSNLSGSDIGDKRLIGYADGKSFFSVLDGSNWELKYSTDWGVNLTAAGNIERAEGQRSGFVFKDCGADDAIMLAIGTDDAYTWDPDTDTFMSDGSIVEGEAIYDFFVLNSTLYLLATSETENAFDIYSGGLVAPLQFYHGIDSLAFKSGVPIGKATPATMAVRSDGVVAIGNNLPEEIMVVQGSAADDYTTWTDISHDHGSTTIKALEWLNG